MKKTVSKISDTIIRLAILAKSKKSHIVTDKEYGHVILAPSSRGNLGDEAMLTAVTQSISSISLRPVTILTHKNDDDWSDIAPGVRQISIQGYFTAVGFLKSLGTLKEVFSRADTFSILGADVMDGAYSRTRTFRRIAMAEYAIRLGVSTKVLGFSYSDKALPSTEQYIKDLSVWMELYCRDVYSYERVKKISRGKTILVADTAFLLTPADPPSAVAAGAIHFITAAHVAGQKAVVFNANPLGSSMSSGAKRGSEQLDGLDVLVTRHVERIMAKAPSLNLVFVPHDPREPHNDRALLQRVYENQSADVKSRIYLAFAGLTARDVKTICAAADLSVTGRMHLGIASLGMATPCLFLDFQGKVRGLLSHFGTEDMFFDWKIYSNSEQFSDFVLAHLEKCNETRAHIQERKTRVLELARLNFTSFSDRTGVL